ncbi:MAG: hypothetical protein PF541_12580 [Prolixibacteraceae bacterium]|nr:hypothetical protein [Prolixibacteraceae bacterium]
MFCNISLLKSILRYTPTSFLNLFPLVIPSNFGSRDSSKTNVCLKLNGEIKAWSLILSFLYSYPIPSTIVVGLKLNIPVTALIGKDDEVTVSEALNWAEITNESFELKIMNENHFFIFDNPDQLLDCFKTRIESCNV